MVEDELFVSADVGAVRVPLTVSLLRLGFQSRTIPSLANVARQVSSIARNVVLAAALCSTATSIDWARGQELNPDYTIGGLVDIYVELALSREAGVNNDEGGILAKWPPDASVRILPQPSATLMNQYGPDALIDETRRVSNLLASLVSSPEIISFDRGELERFAEQARLDGTKEFFKGTLIIFIAQRAEVLEELRAFESSDPSSPAGSFIAAIPSLTEPFCGGWFVERGEQDHRLDHAFVFIEDSDRLTACLFEEIMQSFGLPQDLADGTISIFNDDNVYGEPTELDLLMWRVHSDPRLKAGMREDEIRPLAYQIIDKLLVGTE